MVEFDSTFAVFDLEARDYAHQSGSCTVPKKSHGKTWLDQSRHISTGVAAGVASGSCLCWRKGQINGPSLVINGYCAKAWDVSTHRAFFQVIYNDEYNVPSRPNEKEAMRIGAVTLDLHSLSQTWLDQPRLRAINLAMCRCGSLLN